MHGVPLCAQVSLRLDQALPSLLHGVQCRSERLPGGLPVGQFLLVVGLEGQAVPSPPQPLPQIGNIFALAQPGGDEAPGGLAEQG